LIGADKAPLIFISSDEKLVDIAQATGLAAGNPNDPA
jgi:hypothetical protein